MNKKKRILILSPDTSVKGGISTVIKGYLFSPLADRYDIRCIGTHVDGGRRKKLCQMIMALVKLLRELKNEPIHLAHVHGSDIISSSRKLVFIAILKIWKVPVVYHFHGALFLSQFHSTLRPIKVLLKWLFETVDTVICLSSRWREDILRIAPRSNVIVIANGILIPPFQTVERKKSIPSVTFLGLIGDRKGIFDLLKVIRFLADACVPCHLYVGGNGDIERLHREISLHGIEHLVTYLGWVDNRQKDELLRKTDVFALPSYGEGMPMSILEAMSYGIPVVSSTVGGIPEMVINGKNGYLIQPGDTDQLFNVLMQLLKNNSHRTKLGLDGRKIVEKKYNHKRTIVEIEQIYEKQYS